MSRRSQHTVAYSALAEKIYQDFTSPEYWQSLMGVYRVLTPRSEITRFESSDSGTDIVFTHRVPLEDFPPFARAVLPSEVLITREQHLDPFDHTAGHATGTYGASIALVPGHLRGRYLLTDTDTGSLLRLDTVCKVHLPFIGGKFEGLVLHHLTEIFHAEEAFTAGWIAEHH